MTHSCLAVDPLLLVLGAMPLRADDFQSGDVKIHYTVQGSGTPVVLIHGLTASGMMNWTLPGTTALLAQNHQVILPDMRGHGASDKPTEESAYGVVMVQDVIGLMDHLHIQKAYIVGYSMGGMIGMKLAVLHPERVKGLILGGMGWLKEGGLQQEFWAGVSTKNQGRESALQACAKGFSKLAVTEAEVKSLTMPAAIIIGEKDPVKRLYVEPLETIRPDWPVTVVPGAGHIICVIKPEFKEAVVKTVDGFDHK